MFAVLFGLFILYYYRVYIFKKCINVCIIVLNMYFYIKKNYTKASDIFILNKEPDDYFTDIFKEYTIIVNTSRSQNVVYINSDLVEEEKVFKQNIINMLNNKNKIVHCSITDNNGDIIVDITDMFKKFVYYYESNDDNIMKLFLKYIQRYCDRKEIYNNTSIYEYYFTIYMNDNIFSEYIYKVKDIEDMTFRKLLNV